MGILRFVILFSPLGSSGDGHLRNKPQPPHSLEFIFQNHPNIQDV
jgi:hypothetical protein